MLEKNLDILRTEKILKNFSAPFFLYDQESIAANSKSIKKALAELGLNRAGSKFFYSFKANPNEHLAKIILEDFDGIDVSSEREYLNVIKYGVKAENISVSGPAKTDGFLKRLLNDKVHIIHIDSIDEYNLIAAFLKEGIRTPTKFSLRINVDEFSAKLGLAAKSVKLLLERNLIAIDGFHFYLGRESFSREKLQKALQIVQSIAKEFPRNEKYKIYCGPGFPDIHSLNDSLVRLEESDNFDFHFEMGRTLLESAGSYFSKVLAVKESSSGKKEIIVNGGIQHLSTSFISISRQKNFQILFGRDEKVFQQGDSEANLFGSLCLSNDLLALVDTCPQALSRGDWVYFYPCGAYNISASPNEFIMQDRPSVYLIRDKKLFDIS